MYDCLFVIRNVQSVDRLKQDLLRFSRENNYTINFSPVSNLISEKSIILSDSALVFEPLDSDDPNSFSLLLGYDNISINGRLPDRPLKQRLKFIQELAELCTKSACNAEIFISDGNAFLPDFQKLSISPKDIADSVYLLYKQNDLLKAVPDIHIVLTQC